MKVVAHKDFVNGSVYALKNMFGKIIETTDTFLPYYTAEAASRHTNQLQLADYGSRNDRWMIGISTMSGCPVRCKFCACNALTDKYGHDNLDTEDMMEQIKFVVNKNPDHDPNKSREFKILFTRMGEPALNHVQVMCAISRIHDLYPTSVVAISTVGVGNNPFLHKLAYNVNNYWRKDFIQLQFSVHSTNEEYRKWLIPIKLMSLNDIARFGDEWNGERKITLNFTLTKSKQHECGNVFDTNVIRRHFNPYKFFIKLSPLNDNQTSESNLIDGVVPQSNY